MTYYNEFDPKAAQWIRELIKEGVIPNGIVDERSIENVRADELTGFRQCHFFAGIAGWPFALRLAGISDDFPCWTGSCPCQPFSNAGEQKGTEDERDLWPVFAKLITDCKPQYVFGEQVASAIKFGWIDRVHADLEREGYTCGEVVLGAHSVGANHIRQRLYWGATRLSNTRLFGQAQCEQQTTRNVQCSDINGLSENSAGLGRRGRSNADSAGNNGQIQAQGLGDDDGVSEDMDDLRYQSILEHPERAFPLCSKDAVQGRAMLLKGYGNSIVPQLAAEFIKAFLTEELNK